MAQSSPKMANTILPVRISVQEDICRSKMAREIERGKVEWEVQIKKGVERGK